jgi:hypothetical protein
MVVASAILRMQVFVNVVARWSWKIRKVFLGDLEGGRMFPCILGRGRWVARRDSDNIG